MAGDETRPAGDFDRELALGVLDSHVPGDGFAVIVTGWTGLHLHAIGCDGAAGVPADGDCGPAAGCLALLAGLFTPVDRGGWLQSVGTMDWGGLRVACCEDVRSNRATRKVERPAVARAAQAAVARAQRTQGRCLVAVRGLVVQRGGVAVGGGDGSRAERA